MVTLCKEIEKNIRFVPFSVNYFQVLIGQISRLKTVGEFRDTYLGRQVVSRPGGPREGMGSAGVWGAL